MWWHDIILAGQHLARECWPKISFWNSILRVVGEPSVIPPVDFGINNKNFFVKKNLVRPDVSFFKEHNSRLQRATRLVLAASESICRTFNVFDLYRRFSSAIRRIVGSLTPTIDADFRNDCPESSKISAWAFNDCGSPRVAFFRMTLSRWHKIFVGLF